MGVRVRKGKGGEREEGRVRKGNRGETERE